MYTPLMRSNKGWWQITWGHGGHAHTHTHVASYNVLQLGFATSCNCILGSRGMHMQMPTMLIVIKGHLPLRVFPSSSLFIFFISHSLSVFFSPTNRPHPLHSATFSNLSHAAKQLIQVSLLSCSQVQCEQTHRHTVHTHISQSSLFISSACFYPDPSHFIGRTQLSVA